MWNVDRKHRGRAIRQVDCIREGGLNAFFKRVKAVALD